MRVIGFDPGTAIMGYGVIESVVKNDKPTVLDFGCIMTDPSRGAGERLRIIHTDISKLISKHRPDIVAVESIYFFKNLKTAMPVSQAKGMVLLAAAQKNVPAIEFTPLQVKMTVTGYGKASKQQIQSMVRELVDVSGFDAKKMGRKKDDAFDALGVALCGLFQSMNSFNAVDNLKG